MRFDNLHINERTSETSERVTTYLMWGEMGALKSPLYAARQRTVQNN